VRRELRELQQDERELARRVELLQYQVSEINAAALRVGEEEELLQERTRLANAEQLQSLAEEAYHRLYEGGEEQLSATDLLGRLSRAWRACAATMRDGKPGFRRCDDVQYQPAGPGACAARLPRTASSTTLPAG
jgi:DNA repair ATPase RecN